MTIKVALNHLTTYRFERPVFLGPHIIRLRPAPRCYMPVQDYSFKVHTPEHSLYWQQDPYGNFLARLIFPQASNEIKLEVELIADIQPINPFNFLVEPDAETYPFTYDRQLAKELIPFLEITESGPLLQAWVAEISRQKRAITDFIVSLNQHLQQEITYSLRLEPGIQSCEETLSKKMGSCRDSGWLLVQILRHCGLAARFVSGYLIQLVPQGNPPDGPKVDSAALHAWAEVYLPGAGWIGLDPTSGLLAAEGHIALACTADPERAAPVTGSTEACETHLDYSLTVSRLG